MKSLILTAILMKKKLSSHNYLKAYDLYNNWNIKIICKIILINNHLQSLAFNSSCITVKTQPSFLN